MFLTKKVRKNKMKIFRRKKKSRSKDSVENLLPLLNIYDLGFSSTPYVLPEFFNKGEKLLSH